MVGFFFSFFVSFFLFGVFYMSSSGLNLFYVFDDLSLYMTLLSLVIALSLVCFVDWVSLWSFFLVMLSIMFAMLCWCCVNGFWFWVFYEMSILPLLYLLVVDSPYSDRYSAFWYFMGYVVFTSLPMVACILWFSLKYGSFSVVFWELEDGVDVVVMFLLAVLFVTKIPLPPFHVWLPLVHAESSVYVSACLSGYVMKLGVVGMIRFCSPVICNYLFVYFSVFVMLVFSIFFILSSVYELDCKRWLALSSLGHIVVVPVCVFVSDCDGLDFVYLYCLGHGVSSSLAFLLFGVVSSMGGTRSLFFLKSSFFSSIFSSGVSGFTFLFVSSFPPAIQFFCEVGLLVMCSKVSFVLTLMVGVYVFLGGLVPVVFFGLLYVRCGCFVPVGVSWFYYSWFSLIFLVFWGVSVFLVV